MSELIAANNEFYRLAKRRAYDPETFMRSMRKSEEHAARRNESRIERKRALNKDYKRRRRADPVCRAKDTAYKRKYMSEMIPCDDGKTRTRGAEIARKWLDKDGNRERHNERVKAARATPEGRAKLKTSLREKIEGDDGKVRSRQAEYQRRYRQKHPEYRKWHNARSKELFICEDKKIRSRGSRFVWLRRHPEWRIEGFVPTPVKTGAAQ